MGTYGSSVAPTKPRQLPLFTGKDLFAKESLRELNELGLVHRWYSYVQDFPPSLIWEKFQEYHLKKRQVVLDPFAGGGTTLVVAKLQGIDSIGNEANPLMAFVSRVKTHWELDPSSLARLGQQILSRSKEAFRSGNIEAAFFDGIPQRSGNKWLNLTVQREACALRQAIWRAEDSNKRDFLALAFGQALFKSSNVKLCPGITFIKNRKVPPLFETFEDHLSMMIADLRVVQQFDSYGRIQTIEQEDARQLTRRIPSQSADFLITSPPYPGDVEYTRQTRLEMYALGFIQSFDDVKAIKRKLLRSSVKNIWRDDNNASVVKRFREITRISEEIARRVADKDWGWDYPRMVREYFGDMLLCLREFREILKPGAYCLLVVGDQSVKGVLIPVGKILSRIGKHVGLKPVRIGKFRVRRSTTHRMPLDENIVVLQR